MSIEVKNLMSQLNAIVSLPSVSSAIPELDTSNKEVIEFLANSFDSLGFSCEMIPCSMNSNKLNLIATYGNGPGGLVLSGHTDTVPFDDKLWTFDPFKASESEGRIYGLGITDMKGFFPIVLESIKPLLRETFKEPLIILATADEETSMQGARTIAEIGRPVARAAVIGEPTGLQPVKAHKGMMMDSIRLIGKSGHSSDPTLGVNALDGMHKVIADLMLYRDELREKYSSNLFSVPQPTLNLGCIHGGDNPNRICGECELKFDVRLTPGMNLDSVRTDIKTRLKRITEPLNLNFEMNQIFTGIPAFFAEENSKLLEAAEALTGHNGITVGFGTEGPFLRDLGMDTIVMGPGNIDQAHKPDEYMSIDMIRPTIKVLRQLVSNYCLDLN
tara:strand:- start:43 stop:1203 length:1161 start_codon:yes stop_codon:yes gene_type:complete